MKTTFQRLSSKTKTYRNYSKFYHHKFRETLVKDLFLTHTWNNDISILIGICMRSLDNHARVKKKYIRGNHHSFMNKELSKAVMH